MKIILAAILLFGSVQLLADSKTDRELKIDSFFFVENGAQKNTAAELCGHVTGTVHVHDRITVVADPKAKTPGFYTTQLNKTGHFCVVLRTVSGTASAQLWSMGNPEYSLIEDASITKK